MLPKEKILKNIIKCNTMVLFQQMWLAINLLVGERIRDVTYAGNDPERIDLFTHPQTFRKTHMFPHFF